MFAVVMGVSGSGKSTLGRALAAELDVVFVDADDLHPPHNVEKMAAGTPLTDEDRWPWLDLVGQEGRAMVEGVGGVVVACSALRRSYRDVLRLHGATHFIHLIGDRQVLQHRLEQRTTHWMGAGMLDSQMATLQTPADDERDVLTVRADGDPGQLALSASSWIVEGIPD